MSQIVIRQINQIDNHHFQIEWSDGVSKIYNLSELQQRCPCAGCVDGATGQRRPHVVVHPEVKAVTIHSVGRYALKIQFTSGCSAGIYHFEMLVG